MDKITTQDVPTNELFQIVCVNHEYIEVVITTTASNPNNSIKQTWMQCKYCGKILPGQEQTEYINSIIK